MTSCLCPITGSRGELLRTRTPQELANSYHSYFGSGLPSDIIQKYFTETIQEYQSQESGLRWYTPGIPAQQDFYNTLGKLYSWYYRDESWDKSLALQILKQSRTQSFVEIGSGNGAFLRQAKMRGGITGYGLDINQEEISRCRREGLLAFNIDAPLDDLPQTKTLCLFQTIEHVLDPVAYLKKFMNIINPTTILISAPCHEALLGYTKDPLSWPPHHFSAWSEQAFHSLAKKIDCRCKAIFYEPLSYTRMEGMLAMEKSRSLFQLPAIPQGQVGVQFIDTMKRKQHKWAMYSHSIFAILKKNK